MTSREETALEKASATGRTTVEYTWKFQSAEFAGDEVPLGRRYTLDLNAMTQTNQETKKVRRLLRIPVSSWRVGSSGPHLRRMGRRHALRTVRLKRRCLLQVLLVACGFGCRSGLTFEERQYHLPLRPRTWRCNMRRVHLSRYRLIEASVQNCRRFELDDPGKTE